jgi:hypothetical protein
MESHVGHCADALRFFESGGGPASSVDALSSITCTSSRTSCQAGGKGVGFDHCSTYASNIMTREPELLAISLDPSPAIEAYKKHVDRTLLRENLKLTTGQRVVKMIAALRLAEELRRSSGTAAKR